MKTETDVIDDGVKHGDLFFCPTCGAPGKIDLKTRTGAQPEFSLSIWWNQLTGWECTECWLKQ